MIYPTLKATVHKGKIKLLDNIDLPEDALLLVTVLDSNLEESMTLGEHLIRGLQDIAEGNVVLIETDADLANHLDSLFAEPL